MLLSQVQEVVQRTFHFPQKQKYLKRSQDVFCDINHVWLNICQGGSILGVNTKSKEDATKNLYKQTDALDPFDFSKLSFVLTFSQANSTLLSRSFFVAT